MKLPFLKNKKIPRIADPKRNEPMDDDLDALESHCVGELMEAVERKDIKAFMAAIEALVLNCFEGESNGHAA